MHHTSSVAIVRAEMELPKCRVIKFFITESDILLKVRILYAHRA